MLFCALAVMATAILGMVFDLGRMFIVKSELQAYADSAAMYASTKLDGTSGGIDRANTAASTGPLSSTAPNTVNMSNQTISSVTTTFATAYPPPGNNWDSYSTARGSATNAYRFVQVSVSAPTNLYFLPIIRTASSSTLSAKAIGGQRPMSGVSDGGLVPFSPDAHDPSDTRYFGLTPGLQYTLKWGNGNSTTCAGDAGFDPGNAPSQHGFVDLGQGNSNSLLREAITYSTYPKPDSDPSSVDVGTVLGGVPGNRGSSIFDALADRSAQDPDQTSTTWAQYLAAGGGNGRRVVTAAVNDPALASGNGNNATVTVIGFGNFLLDPADTISGSSGAICATYIGPASTSGASSGGTDGTKVYKSQLYE